MNSPYATVTAHPRATLPETALPWLRLYDHFIATVGPAAGQGRALGPLLVLADATFAPHSRFPRHPHREVEILSVVIDGTLSHHGDQANGQRVGPRGAQLISSRDGMFHAEGNDTDAPTRMLQLWFEPTTRGGAPAYFSRSVEGRGRELLAGDAVMPLRCDAKVWWLSLEPGAPAALMVPTGRRGYLLALTASMRVTAAPAAGAVVLGLGDGATLGPGAASLTADTAASALWIELP